VLVITLQELLLRFIIVILFVHKLVSLKHDSW